MNKAAPFGAALVLAALFCGPALAQDASDVYLAQLEQRAYEQKLADDPYWRTLLHYETPRLGHARGQVVSPWFYLAKDGRDDPAAELDATLAAFFDGAARAPRDEPAQCIYGARYRWLAQRLAFDPGTLPPQACARRETWMKALAPRQVWVVFPSAYMNSPASMFGHTLLRLDGSEVGKGTALLAYAVNFAANTDETNGLLFAAKGLFGGYNGSFSVLPYYEKVKEYTRMESRDLWEYPVALTEAQKEMLLLHLWELRGAEFTYAFFTHNCSYELLTLLQAANPAIQWGTDFRLKAIPTDTLRTLAPWSGPPHFRASLETQVGGALAQLDRRGVDDVVALAAGERPPAAPPDAEAREHARELSLANDVVNYRFLSGALDRDTALPRSQALLRARAQIGTDAAFAPPVAPATPPSGGHATHRAALELASDGDRTSVLARWRPAYHDLLDDPRGYGAGAQIQFLDLALGTQLSPQRWEWSARVIDIVSVAPRDAVFHPISWRVRFGAERAPLGRGLADGVLEGGPGVAYGRFDRVVGYGFLMARADVCADLGKGQSFGAGPLLGVLAQPRAGWQLQLEGAWLPTVEGSDLDRRWLTLGQQWRLNDAYALRLTLDTRRLETRETNSATLGLQYYF